MGQLLIGRHFKGSMFGSEKVDQDLNEIIIINLIMLALSVKRLVYYFARRPEDIGKMLTTSSIVKTKQQDRQLSKLKQMLAAKEPLPSDSIYEEYHHREIYQRIDTDLQAFFYKREYNLENFNFLVNLLGHQRKIANIPIVLDKMQLLNIEPDQRTYNYIIKAASMNSNVQLAESYFSKAVERFGISKYFYTSLMKVYVNQKNPDMAYKILQQMIEKGLQPDLPVYTTLINSFRVGRKLSKCWELNKMILQKKMDLDQTYVGVILKVYAATHDAQKAIKLYREHIVIKNVKPMIETTNSYFKALSTRPQYSPKVVDQFLDMVENGELFNLQTIQWALKAAATTANVKSAVEIVKIMRSSNREPTKQIYTSLLRVYANACDLPNVPESFRQVMLMDSWKLLQQIMTKNMLDTIILNNVLLIHANSLKLDQIEGLILPIYEKYGLKYNAHTYEILVDINYKRKDFNTAIRVWQQMKLQFEQEKKRQIEIRGVYSLNRDLLNEDLRPTFNLLENYIQIGIRMMNMHMILEALQWFKKLNRHPKNSTLKFLGNIKNLPQEIVVSLMDFQIRFGAAKLKKTKSNSERQVQDPQNR